jgi:3-hydroxybutyryl-CoA dehydrogenase
MIAISTICVCGAGTMGSGIAQVAAQHGFNTIQFDVNESMLQKSHAAITKNLQLLVSKQKLTAEQQTAIMGRMVFTTDPAACKADIIIEAIVEKPEAKVALFQQMAAQNPDTTILASNTSSISINTIAQHIPHPQRVAGLHFFNPAPLMKLVEVVKGTTTANEVIQTLTGLCTQLGKTPVVCSDAPGFIVNRVARHYYLEAMHLVEQGLATIETVDAVMEASGFKMGPFKLMDLIGMDINFGVSQIVWDALGKPARLKPSALQQQKVAEGNLGRKTGKGFYNY